jgi:hypothetical protein
MSNDDGIGEITEPNVVSPILNWPIKGKGVLDSLNESERIAGDVVGEIVENSCQGYVDKYYSSYVPAYLAQRTQYVVDCLMDVSFYE